MEIERVENREQRVVNNISSSPPDVSPRRARGPNGGIKTPGYPYKTPRGLDVFRRLRILARDIYVRAV